MDREVVAQAKELGFDFLDTNTQRIILNKARMFGWDGKMPVSLNSRQAELALAEAVAYLTNVGGLKFRKEQ